MNIVVNLIKTISKYINFILSPPACRYCRVFLQDYEILCDFCLDKVKSIPSYNLIISKDYSVPVYAVSNYKEPLKSLILAKGRSDYSACIDLARLIWRFSVLKNVDFDYLVAVPCHWTRSASRGYNQAEVIAQELSRLSCKTILKCLKRSKKTAYQSSLSGDDRAKNVQDAFVVITKFESCLEGKKIMLVDDLMTTGSTISASAKVLFKFNVSQVHAVVACRVC